MARSRSTRWLSLPVVPALLAALVAAAGAQATAPGQSPPPPGPAAFTIRSILVESAERQHVRIEFSRPFDERTARERLRLVPPVGHHAWTSPANTLNLEGSFRHGTRYVVKFSEGFAAADGTPYTETVKEFAVPDKAPALRFSGVGAVVERASRQLVHFETVNVGSTLLETVQLSPAAALALMDNAAPWDERLAQAQRLAAALAQAVPARDPLRRFVAGGGTRRDLFDTKGKPNEEATFSIPLSQRPERENGTILLARLRDNAAGGSAQTDPAVFTVTDLGITCLAGPRETLVWVTSLETGLPLAGVDVAGFTADGLLFHAGKTDRDGLLSIPAGAKEGYRVAVAAGQPEVRPQALAPERYALHAVAAALEGDAAFQRVPDGAHLAVTVPGIRRTSAIAEEVVAANAAVFTERGAYRPGETLHVKGVARRFENGAIGPAAGWRYTFEVTDSRGRRVHEAAVALSEFGTAAIDVPLPASAPLGEYQVELRGAGQSARATFRVEEFAPPRHFARVGFAPRRRTDDTFTGRPVEMDFLAVTIEGGYYAGGPVKNARVRWQLSYGPSARRVKGWDDYLFGHEAEEGGAPPAPLESGEAFLDADGRLTVEFPVSAEVAAGERTLAVTAAVLDFDGRAASATGSWQPEPRRQIGIAAHATNVVAGGEQELVAVLVDADGDRVREGVLAAEVLRRSWTHYRKRNLAGNEYWVSERVWKRARAVELPLRDGEARFPVSFEGYGEYLVRFTHRAADGSVCSSATRFQVGWEPWDERQAGNLGYTRIPIATDRPRYRPGQKARLRVGARQRAAAWLLTVERQGIVSARVLRPQGELPELEVPLTDASAPNVYASLVGTVPRGPFPVYSGRIDDGVPTFLHGVVNLPVVKRPAALAVAIAPGEKQELTAEPGREVALSFSVTGEDGRGARAELAVAVVDESVLALTGHRAPDLAGITRFDLPLGVFLDDTRRLLIPQTPFRAVRSEALTGGGEGAEGSALETRRVFKAVAYWNPALLTDAAGRAEVRFTLPDQMTAFRITVVACDAGSAFGTAERKLRVTKPFYLEAGLPRFFTRGDRFRFNVAAFNQTGEGGVMDFAFGVEGPLSLAVGQRSYPLPARGRAEVPVSGTADAAGAARLRVEGRFGALGDAVELPLPVRSGHVRGQQVWYGSLKGSATVAPPLADEVRAIAGDPELLADTTAVLTLSGSPFLRMTEGLRYLLRYPYGCVEQTSSGVLPLAALRGILRSGAVPGIASDEADPFLAKGVERLLSMQNGSGGFGYWPGDREASPWGTFYATTALAEARDAGFSVPAEAIERLAAYLRDDRLRRPPEEAGSAMALYLLARIGKARPADFAAVGAGLDRLAREPRILALLAAAHAGSALGTADMAGEARAAIAAPRDHAEYHYGFNGKHRSDALALLLLDRVAPGDPEGAALAARLLEARNREGHWGRTSDTGWVLAALGRHFAAEAEGAGTHRVVVRLPGGAERTLEVPARGAAELTLNAAELLASPTLSLAGDPGREALYSLALTFPRADYAAHGHDGGFRIARRIENADGSPEIRVGDLVRVTLEFSPPESGSQHVVLDDPLPAGLVAINAAFQSEEGLPRDNDAAAGRRRGDADFWSSYWSPDGYYRFVPDHLELRDDRVVAFREDLWGWGGASFRFVYYARAVCEGEFVAPSTRIERMYEPDVNGYTPRGVLAIGGRMK